MSNEMSTSSEEMPFTAADMAELKTRLEADRLVTENRTKIEGGGEIVQYVPEVTRKDETTDEDVIPLLFVRGMGNSEALPWYLNELAQADQRPVIGIQYNGPLEGSSKLAESESIEGSASEIDFKQAGDIAAALETLGVSKVDMVAESRGAIRAVIVLRQHPERFRNVILDHPAGQDDRNYRQAHIDAAREQLRRVKDRDANAIPEDIPREGGSKTLSGLSNTRKEQKSVARARLHEDLGKIDPNIHVVVTGDRDDQAFLSERLKQTAGSARAAGASIEFAETQWGGHGYRYNPEALKETVDRLRKMEQARTAN